MPSPSPDERLEALERVVAHLAREVRTLTERIERAERAGALASGSPIAPTTAPLRAEPVVGAVGERRVGERRASSQPAPATARFAATLSRLGLAMIAALLFLAGVGILIRWAVRAGHFGPSAQLAAGAALTGSFYLLGGMLWRQGADRRAFARVIFALALAATHILAWGAGPRLHLLPDGAALMIVLICAAGVGILAHRDDDGTLFAVGVVGALAVPLIAGTPHTTRGEYGLALYVAAVLASGVYGVRDRDWPLAMRTLSVALAIYGGMLASIAMGELRQSPWALLLPVAVAVVAALATRLVPRMASRDGEGTAALPTRLQIGLARTATLVISALALTYAQTPMPSAVPLLTLATGLVLLHLCVDLRRTDGVSRSGERPSTRMESWPALADGLVTPALLVGAALTMPSVVPGAPGAWLRAGIVAAVGVVLGAGSLALPAEMRTGLRSASAVLAVAVAGTALPLASAEGMCVAVLATASAVLIALAPGSAAAPQRVWGALTASGLALLLVAMTGLAATVVTGYTRIPGATWPLATLAAIALSAGALTAAGERALRDDGAAWRRAFLVGGTALAAWGWLALAHWRSPLVSTTATIAYEAAIGVALLTTAIRIGADRLRTAGLWTLGFAGVHTLVQVWGMDNDLVKVVVTLLVGCVLLGTAYLTRQREMSV